MNYLRPRTWCIAGALHHRSWVFASSVLGLSEFVTITGLQRTTACCATPGKRVIVSMKNQE